MRELKLVDLGARAHPPWRVVLRDAAIVVAACAAVSSAVNATRADGIPFVQREAHAILVPCPETAGETAPVAPEVVAAQDPRRLVVDARGKAAFAEWHLAGAVNVPFDYLEPVAPDVVRRIATSGSREVAVYGDGGAPDSGEQLAREIAGKGIKNVRFVAGGAPAIRALGQRGVAP